MIPQKFTKNQPLTGLGRFLADTSDPRRTPVHENTDITLIAVMVTILKLQNKYGISVADTNNLLDLMKKIAPPDAVLPKSVAEIEKSTKDLIVHHQEHLVCKCEEFVFHEEDSACAVCKSSKEGAKKYYRIPVGPRLQQLREVPILAKLTTLPLKQSSRYVDDLHLSTGYQRYMNHLGDGAFALSYCSDGFNPFHHHITQGSYSIWAQSGLILNLPQHLRCKIGTTLLYGLISGPQSPKHLGPYNRLLVDELVSLKKDGLLTFNAHTRKVEMVRVGILFLVCDVPGGAKEQSRVQQNAKASCGHCHLLGEHSTILDKTTYAGGRKFLSITDELRQDTTFHDGKPDNQRIVLRTKNEALRECLYIDSLERQKRDKGLDIRTLLQHYAQDTGRYGSNQWIRLDMNLQQRQAPVEPMHLMKVVAEHITKLLNGMEDGPKVRAQERVNGRFPMACPNAVHKTYVTEKQPRGKKRKTPDASNQEEMANNLQQSYPKNQLPPAPFTLTSEEKKIADDRLQSMHFPANFGVVPKVFFTRLCGGTKSHTWYKMFTTGILRFCLRGMLGQSQRETLVAFLVVLEEMFAPSVDTERFPQLEERWHVAICKIERDFPLSLQTLVMHLLHHLPHYIKLYGPPPNFWMYSYERFNKTLGNAITNNQYPELSAVKKITIQWLMAMLESAGLLPNCPSPTDEEPEALSYLSAGAYRPYQHVLTATEKTALMEYYRCHSLDLDSVTVFHYARKGAVYYRDITVEKHTVDRNSVIAWSTDQQQLIGQIQYFFVHCDGLTSQELACVSAIGPAEMCPESKCYVVKNSVPSCKILSIQQLSEPLIHCWEEGKLWVVSL